MTKDFPVAVITGAGAGIGKACAIRFAQEDARVVVVDRNAADGNATVALLKSSGTEALFCEADVSREKDCTLFIAPTDVVLDQYNVVQPDLFLVCDKAKITEDNIKGAPDFIIEVTSPATSIKDKREKKDIYERFGVKEYLIVYPEDELVERFVLEDNKFVGPDIFNWDESMSIESLGLDINLWEIFEKQRKDG